MNVNRIAILGAAAIAAGAAAFLVRGMLGGGTSQSEASIPTAEYATTDVLVAASDVDAGRPLTVNDVRWQAWPKSALAPAYVTRDVQPDVSKAVEGSVVRAPLFSGEPITPAKVIRAANASFMSATLTPGRRAVSILVSAEQTAGGFILPNDRVDIVLTRQIGQSGEKNFQATTILQDVRVLAIDQTAKPDNNTQSAVGKTATLELNEDQAELIAQSQAMGTLSLALRPLGETVDAALQDENSANSRHSGAVSVIRYGVARAASVMGRGQ
jgi:pilus assembly protein CpaB